MTTASYGGEAARRLTAATQNLMRSLSSGARELPKLSGVSQRNIYDQPMENVHSNLAEILICDGRIYRFGNDIVFEASAGEDGELRTLCTCDGLKSSAAGVMANVFICESGGSQESPPIQFAPTRQLLEQAFNRAPTIERLPQIKAYFKRPVFDEAFNLRESGWHPSVGYLLHTFDVQRIGISQTNGAPATPLLDRLLDSFLFKSQSDRTNALGALLTVLLASAFVQCGKALVILDGNQPGVGKTWFATTLGILSDNCEPDLIRHDPKDEELEKRICASIRRNKSSLVVIDNAKSQTNRAVSSTVIESQSVAPTIGMRVLGSSNVFERANDLIWLLTMNQTQISSDLVSRSITIQFFCEGNPAEHRRDGFNPIRFAKSNRTGIFSELIAMVEYWTSTGRHPGTTNHRLRDWAQTIGGILSANGHSGFLENAERLAAQIDYSRDNLVLLAEHAFRSHLNMFVGEGRSECSVGLRASELVDVVATVPTLSEIIGDGSKQSQSTKLGSYLSGLCDREVTFQVEIDGEIRDHNATFRFRGGRGNQKLYYFEFSDLETRDDPDDGAVRCGSEIIDTPQAPTPLASDLNPATSMPPGDSGNQEDWG